MINTINLAVIGFNEPWIDVKIRMKEEIDSIQEANRSGQEGFRKGLYFKVGS